MLKINLERETNKNRNYRKVINTTTTQQLVLMCINPGVEIGQENHPDTTQFLKVESGTGIATVDNGRFILKPGDSLTIPPGAIHNVWCPVGHDSPLKLYTIYSPPHHLPGTIHRVKID